MVDQSRLLVIDDDVALCSQLTHLFTRAGYVVETAPSGAAGLARLQASDIDLVLLDLCLPDLMGDDVCRRIRQRDDPVYLPVIMLTGVPAAQASHEAFRAGADDYVVKPYTLQELQDRVHGWLQVRARLRQLWEQQQQALAALLDARAAEARLEGVQLAAREVAHRVNNDLTVSLGTLDRLGRHPALPASLQAEVETAIGGLLTAVGHVNRLHQVVRVATRPTPMGPALDLERSVARQPA